MDLSDTNYDMVIMLIIIIILVLISMYLLWKCRTITIRIQTTQLSDNNTQPNYTITI